MKAIIIEDESVAATSLCDLLKETAPEVEIVTILQSVEESVEWLRTERKPDLIFMDIHLADGSSFAIFDQVTITSPVIFTTAYDEYALKAFEVNSIDYLLKPIGKDELTRAVNKFRHLSDYGNDRVETLHQVVGRLREAGKPYKNSFLIPVKDKLVPLAVRDISYIYIDSKVVTAVTSDGRPHMLSQTLDEVMDQLDPEHFYRANRQFIIARTAVKDISMWFGGKLAVNLNIDVPERIYVSKARVRDFKNWITG